MSCVVDIPNKKTGKRTPAGFDIYYGLPPPWLLFQTGTGNRYVPPGRRCSKHPELKMKTDLEYLEHVSLCHPNHCLRCDSPVSNWAAHVKRHEGSSGKKNSETVHCVLCNKAKGVANFNSQHMAHHFPMQNHVKVREAGFTTMKKAFEHYLDADVARIARGAAPLFPMDCWGPYGDPTVESGAPAKTDESKRDGDKEPVEGGNGDNALIEDDVSASSADGSATLAEEPANTNTQQSILLETSFPTPPPPPPRHDVVPPPSAETSTAREQHSIDAATQPPVANPDCRTEELRSPQRSSMAADAPSTAKKFVQKTFSRVLKTSTTKHPDVATFSRPVIALATKHPDAELRMADASQKSDNVAFPPPKRKEPPTDNASASDDADDNTQVPPAKVAAAASAASIDEPRRSVGNAAPYFTLERRVAQLDADPIVRDEVAAYRQKLATIRQLELEIAADCAQLQQKLDQRTKQKEVVINEFGRWLYSKDAERVK